MEKGYQYTGKYEISYFDVDKNKNLKIHTLIDICNNISSLHSESYNIGINYLKENNFAWVFLKTSIELNRIPKYLDTLTVTTYAVGVKKFFASRFFDIYDQNGENIGTIKGLYCLIDTTTRKPIPIPNGLMERYGTKNSCIALKELKLKPPAPISWKKEFEVRYYDIDTNGHVNSSIYPMWCLEALPINYHENKIITSMDIIFEKEVTYGEKIMVTSTNIDENNIIQGIYNSNNDLTTLVRSSFKS